MTTPTVTELVRNGNRVGQRVELALQHPTGERVLYGQRINGVIRLLPEELVAVVHGRIGARYSGADGGAWGLEFGDA